MLDWISEISSILGLWTVVGIIAILILCWRRIRFSALFWAEPYLWLLEELEDLKQRVQRKTVCDFAPKTEKYLIHTAGCPAYNTGCLQCTPNRRGFTDRRDVESSNM